MINIIVGESQKSKKEITSKEIKPKKTVRWT